MTQGPFDSTANRLRVIFDEGFSRPIEVRAEEWEEFLLLRAGGELFALLVKDASGLVKCPRITLLPSTNPALVGLSAVRGAIIAIYDLGVLLKRTPARSKGKSGWLIIPARDRTCALLCEAQEGYARAPKTRIKRASGGKGDEHNVDIVMLDDRTATILTQEHLLAAVHR